MYDPGCNTAVSFDTQWRGHLPSPCIVNVFLPCIDLNWQRISCTPHSQYFEREIKSMESAKGWMFRSMLEANHLAAWAGTTSSYCYLCLYTFASQCTTYKFLLVQRFSVPLNVWGQRLHARSCPSLLRSSEEGQHASPEAWSVHQSNT